MTAREVTKQIADGCVDGEMVGDKLHLNFDHDGAEAIIKSYGDARVAEACRERDEKILMLQRKITAVRSGIQYAAGQDVSLEIPK